MTMADSKQTLSNRLTELHRRMEEAKVDAYLVLSSDAHLNEYVPEYTRRRTAITGFRGSAGDVLVCPDGSHLFVDSRYHIQADDEVDHDNFRVHKLGLAEEKSLSQWLTEMEKERGSIRVGFDPFVVSMQAHSVYKSALKSPDSALVPLNDNLVDAVWDEQPPPPANPVYQLPDDLTGCAVAEKLSDIRKEMEDAGATLLVLTKLDETAWVTNLRGTDIEYNPVFEGYLVIDPERATCFTRVSPPADVTDSLASLIDFETIRRLCRRDEALRRGSLGHGLAGSQRDHHGYQADAPRRTEAVREAQSDSGAEGNQERNGNCRLPKLPPSRRRRQDTQLQAPAGLR